MGSAGQHGRGIVRIGAAVPQQQRPRDVAFGRRDFRSESAAANGQASGGIAQRCQRPAGESMLARYLTHDLHQAPGKRPGASFAFIGDRAASKLWLDVARIEGRLVAQRPAVPGRFLLDDGADQFGPQRLRVGGIVRQGDKFGGRGGCSGCDAGCCAVSRESRMLVVACPA